MLTSTRSRWIEPQRADVRQRAHFVRIGQGFNPRPLICCLVITASDATLRARLAARTDHPTLTSEEMALDVLRHMKRQWVAPSYREGFDRILTLREDEQPPLWDAASLQVVLDRLARSQPRNSPWSGGRGRGRGQGGDSYRGTFPGRGGYTRGAYPRHESGLDSRREQGAARARPPHGQQRGNQDGQPPRWGMTNTRPPMHAPFASNSASARTGSQYNGQARSGSSIQEETGPSGALQTPATLKPAPI